MNCPIELWNLWEGLIGDENWNVIVSLKHIENDAKRKIVFVEILKLLKLVKIEISNK